MFVQCFALGSSIHFQAVVGIRRLESLEVPVTKQIHQELIARSLRIGVLASANHRAEDAAAPDWVVDRESPKSADSGGAW